MSLPPEVHRWARDVVKAAWLRTAGAPATLFQAQCVQALAWNETKYGYAWSDAGAGSHNWGSVHARGDEPSFDWVDHYPDGTPYNQRMRTYPDDVAGASDVIAKMRAAAGPELDAAEGTDDVWRALYYGHYYGAWCKEASAKYGAAVREAFAWTGKRATTEAGQACEAESIKMGQDAGANYVAFIASALGEPASPRSSSSSSSTPATSPRGSGALGGLVGFGLLAGAAFLIVRH